MDKYIDELLSFEQWSEALEALESQQKNYGLTKPDSFKLGLIYFNLNQYEKGFEFFTTLDWSNYTDCSWLRRMVIAPLIKIKNFIWPEKLLKLILTQHPESILDLTTLSSILIRQNQRTQACTYLEKILILEKGNYQAVSQLMQIKLQDNKLDMAVLLAKQYAFAFPLNERLFTIGLQVLAKAREFEFCLEKIQDINFSKQALNIGILALQIAFDSKNYNCAQHIILQLQQADYKDPRIGLILAKIKLLSGVSEAQVIEILIKAHELDPQNIQVNNLLGDLLLKIGNYQQALYHLKKLSLILPANPQTRILHAKALKFTGNYAEAAEEMLEVVKLLPNCAKWKRYAASALMQAGCEKEAKNIFYAGIEHREKQLPESFEQGLDQLWSKVENLTLPQARLDWLHTIVQHNNSNDKIKRNTYEELAKWIYLLDHFLLEWLECRPNQADEAMVFFEDLSATYDFLKEEMSKGRGVILVGVHIGLLFSMPMALELFGFPHKWLASSPSISSMPYKDTLISTSDNTETEVVRQIIKTLNQKSLLAMAIDGAINPAAPRVEFEKQKITYSDFAAKMSYRTRASTLFTVPYWKNNNFCLKLERLPAPLPEENIEEFCSRWSKNFFNILRNFLMLNPENARLSGGIWRDIR